MAWPVGVVLLAGIVGPAALGQAGGEGVSRQSQMVAEEIAELQSAVFPSGEPIALDGKNLRQYGAVYVRLAGGTVPATSDSSLLSAALAVPFRIGRHVRTLKLALSDFKSDPGQVLGFSPSAFVPNGQTVVEQIAVDRTGPRPVVKVTDRFSASTGRKPRTTQLEDDGVVWVFVGLGRRPGKITLRYQKKWSFVLPLDLLKEVSRNPAVLAKQIDSEDPAKVCLALELMATQPGRDVSQAAIRAAQNPDPQVRLVALTCLSNQLRMASLRNQTGTGGRVGVRRSAAFRGVRRGVRTPTSAAMVFETHLDDPDGRVARAARLGILDVESATEAQRKRAARKLVQSVSWKDRTTATGQIHALLQRRQGILALQRYVDSDEQRIAVAEQVKLMIRGGVSRSLQQALLGVLWQYSLDGGAKVKREVVGQLQDLRKTAQGELGMLEAMAVYHPDGSVNRQARQVVWGGKRPATKGGVSGLKKVLSGQVKPAMKPYWFYAHLRGRDEQAAEAFLQYLVDQQIPAPAEDLKRWLKRSRGTTPLLALEVARLGLPDVKQRSDLLALLPELRPANRRVLMLMLQSVTPPEQQETKERPSAARRGFPERPQRGLGRREAGPMGPVGGGARRSYGPAGVPERFGGAGRPGAMRVNAGRRAGGTVREQAIAAFTDALLSSPVDVQKDWQGLIADPKVELVGGQWVPGFDRKKFWSFAANVALLGHDWQPSKTTRRAGFGPGRPGRAGLRPAGDRLVRPPMGLGPAERPGMVPNRGPGMVPGVRPGAPPGRGADPGMRPERGPGMPPGPGMDARRGPGMVPDRGRRPGVGPAGGGPGAIPGPGGRGAPTHGLPGGRPGGGAGRSKRPAAPPGFLLKLVSKLAGPKRPSPIGGTATATAMANFSLYAAQTLVGIKPEGIKTAPNSTALPISAWGPLLKIPFEPRPRWMIDPMVNALAHLAVPLSEAVKQEIEGLDLSQVEELLVHAVQTSGVALERVWVVLQSARPSESQGILQRALAKLGPLERQRFADSQAAALKAGIASKNESVLMAQIGTLLSQITGEPSVAGQFSEQDRRASGARGQRTVGGRRDRRGLGAGFRGQGIAPPGQRGPQRPAVPLRLPDQAVRPPTRLRPGPGPGGAGPAGTRVGPGGAERFGVRAARGGRERGAAPKQELVAQELAAQQLVGLINDKDPAVGTAVRKAITLYKQMPGLVKMLDAESAKLRAALAEVVAWYFETADPRVRQVLAAEPSAREASSATKGDVCQKLLEAVLAKQVGRTRGKLKIEAQASMIRRRRGRHGQPDQVQVKKMRPAKVAKSMRWSFQTDRNTKRTYFNVLGTQITPAPGTYGLVILVHGTDLERTLKELGRTSAAAVRLGEELWLPLVYLGRGEWAGKVRVQKDLYEEDLRPVRNRSGQRRPGGRNAGPVRRPGPAGRVGPGGMPAGAPQEEPAEVKHSGPPLPAWLSVEATFKTAAAKRERRGSRG